ncbi:MAG TPA: glycosyltransferase family 4 protein [Pyrinomonadaceae bacterium]|nr:glycosyltransferase family 4 protein [Pyrinomonadaceae bacterium]
METVRIGGVGIVTAFFLGLAFLFLVNEPDAKLQRNIFGLSVGALIIAVVSFVDDIYSVSPKYRYLFSVALKYSAQMIAALVAVHYGNRITSFTAISVNETVPLWANIVSFLWIVWMSNAYNFMDGIDGLAGGSGVIFALFTALVATVLGQATAAQISLILAASCLGFLLHNFPHARVFMGDVGAVFLGYCFGSISLMVSAGRLGSSAFVALLIVYAAFTYDATFTLLRRVWREKTIFGPHRTHLYQRLIIQGLTHPQVTLTYYVLSILLGLLALSFLKTSGWGKGAVAILVMVILIIATLAVSTYEQHIHRQLSRR